MRHWILLFVAILTSSAAEIPIPCKQVPGKNGSALCISLKLMNGQIAAGRYRFLPNDAYEDRTSLGEEFLAEATKAIDRLTKPCLAAMSEEQQKAFLSARKDPETAHICTFNGPWKDFTGSFLKWAAAAGNPAPANVLSQNGVFRPLQTLYVRTPLLWIQDSSASLDAENGILTFRIADPLDPRPNGNLQIDITGILDDDVLQRRRAELRRWLDPLFGAVFCADRLRESTAGYYRKIGVTPKSIMLDANGPRIEIEEEAVP